MFKINNINSMTVNLPTINIKAKARHHALFLIIVASLLALVTLLLSQQFWHQYRLVLIFNYLTALVILITGLAKKLEPTFSFNLSPKGIKYNHRYGYWLFSWQQIQRISLIKETTGLAQIELPYLGIKLKDIDYLAKQISPRLANRLIHEQKPLISLAVIQGLLSLEESLLNFNSFTLSSGQIIKGPLAAFLYHCQALHNAFGFHIYLPESSTDRELNDFCYLLKSCMASAKNYD
jgi:hypothetical protein